MGWFNLIANLNNAEGVREAMRMSFDKHLHHGRPEDSPVYAGVFGALSTRRQMQGKPHDEASLLPDLIPFIHMSVLEARDALAEYAVLEERPIEARSEWLGERILPVVRRLREDPGAAPVLFAACARRVRWTQLLPNGTLDPEDLLRRATASG